jgi:hypothetical protein
MSCSGGGGLRAGGMFLLSSKDLRSFYAKALVEEEPCRKICSFP